MSNSNIPRWDNSNVFPDLESEKFNQARNQVNQLISELETEFSEKLKSGPDGYSAAEIEKLLSQAVIKFNELYELYATVQAYVYTFVSTDSFNQTAMRILSELDQPSVRLQKIIVQFEHWVGSIKDVLPKALEIEGPASEHSFAIFEIVERSKYRMGLQEEALAAELSTSGGNAWSKLQGTVTSQLTVSFELDGETKDLPMPALINLNSHPDEDVRRRAYEAEMKAWDGVKETLAACMNGIKGEVNTLDKRRGREDALHSSLESSRIDRETLQAMLAAMQDSFPMFRKYYQAKAGRLGKEKLPWWDLNAPVGNSEISFTFDEARSFIVKNFAKFSQEMADFADQAFEKNWIDAEQRSGKRGGAFCMSVPGVKESRIMCNFDGSLSQVFTIAHELGHAFHNYCTYQAGKTMMQSDTPMTLAETASIMCETIVMNAALEKATNDDEKLAILEESLIGDAAVIVDISSRYFFEKEVFERREKAELSADDLSEIMEQAQKNTYGDGLDNDYLHKYMWTWKPHYYSPELSFYNYPYAFGLLFALGLYAVYQERGESFVADYKNLLSSTGEGTAAELAARFDIDIRDKAFWAGSLGEIGKRIDQYLKI